MFYPNYYQAGYFPQYQNGAVPDVLGQYKAQYGQPVPQPMQVPSSQMSPTNDMVWVLGEVEATSYPVAPNNSVILWDKNEDVIYIKSVNAQGVPSMRIFDYTERTVENTPKTPDKHTCQGGGKFLSVEAFEKFKREFEELSSKVNDITSSAKSKSRNKEEVDNG